MHHITVSQCNLQKMCTRSSRCPPYPLPQLKNRNLVILSWPQDLYQDQDQERHTRDNLRTTKFAKQLDPPILLYMQTPVKSRENWMACCGFGVLGSFCFRIVRGLCFIFPKFQVTGPNVRHTRQLFLEQSLDCSCGKFLSILLLLVNWNVWGSSDIVRK